MSGKRTLLLGVGVVVAAAAVGLFWFFSGDAPGEVDLGETASSVGSGNTTDSTSGETVEGIEGTWSVDTSVGEFTLQDTTTAAFAGFRVQEVLSGIGDATAVGRTPDVAGTVTIEGAEVSAAEIRAGLSSIVSNESRRNNAIQRALNTSSNPDATFKLIEPISLGAAAEAGELVTTTARGELTINGVTNEVEFEIQAQLIDSRILITGKTQVDFDDYNISAPSAPVVVSVEETAIVELQLWLTR